MGYSTCHWCHVMERESFENEEVGQLLNKHFVAVKVDREERPDVDRVYMSFVQVGYYASSYQTTAYGQCSGGLGRNQTSDDWWRALSSLMIFS